MTKSYILIVEDDRITNDKIKSILQFNKFSFILQVVSYDEAIEAIDNYKIMFAFIDIELEGDRSGIDVALYCLKKSQFPYVLITAHFNEETMELSKLSRPYGFIAKPFNAERIISVLKILRHNYEHRLLDSNRYPVLSENAQPKKIKEALDYIHENIHKNIKTEDIANQVGWTRSHLSKVFSETLNYSLKEYIIKVKIESACLYLLNNNHKLSFVAEEFGFDNYVSFFNAFKKIKGLTPKKYVENKEKFKTTLHD